MLINNENKSSGHFNLYSTNQISTRIDLDEKIEILFKRVEKNEDGEEEKRSLLSSVVSPFSVTIWILQANEFFSLLSFFPLQVFSILTIRAAFKTLYCCETKQDTSHVDCAQSSTHFV